MRMPSGLTGFSRLATPRAWQGAHVYATSLRSHSPRGVQCEAKAWVSYKDTKYQEIERVGSTPNPEHQADGGSFSQERGDQGEDCGFGLIRPAISLTLPGNPGNRGKRPPKVLVIWQEDSNKH